MQKLRTTPAQLRAQGTKIQQNGEDIASKMEQMIALVNEIGGTTWSGDAATAYKQKFSEMQDDANRMKQLLIDANEALDNIATQYEQAEEANASAVRSLQSDIF